MRLLYESSSWLLVACHFLIVLGFWECGCDGKKDERGDGNKERFEFLRKEAGNELGIYTKAIAHIYRKGNQTMEEWNLNREYLPQDIYESFMSRCEAEPDERLILWRNCESDDKGLFATVTWGVPEPKNKTITYLELEFRPFHKVNENTGVEEMCIMEEVYSTKAYIVLKTFSEIPSNDTFPRGVVESVAQVHQHQLDAFGEHFLSIFEDKIDVELVYSFGEDEYYDRDPPYECFLSIGSSESTSVIQEKCDFFCMDPKGLPEEEVAKILIQGITMAREVEEAEDSIKNTRDEL